MGLGLGTRLGVGGVGASKHRDVSVTGGGCPVICTFSLTLTPNACVF